MSMKCVWVVNHTTHSHSDSFSFTYSQVPEGKYQGVAASLWPVATVQGAELHYICIKKTCYEYEVLEGLNHKNKQRPTSYQQHPLSGPRGQISGCGCILMTSSHCSRCWIALYMYKEDLLWVWSVWGVDIDLDDLSYWEHYPAGMCFLLRFEWGVFAYFRIVTVMSPYISLSPTRMCVRMTMRSFTLGMFKVQFPR